MSDSSLFSEKPKKSFNIFLLIFPIMLVAVLGGAYVLYKNATYKPEVTQEQIDAIKTRDAVAMMLAQPTYSGDSFREQVLGKVRLFRYFLDKEELYFTAPESSEQEFNLYLSLS